MYMTHNAKLYEKAKHRKRRKASAKAKENERLRTASYQRCLDAMAKATKRKGKGRAHKVKGETMPTLLCANSRCAKGWKHLNGNPMRGESMKVSIIWNIT
jgi:hypothetical protein